MNIYETVKWNVRRIAQERKLGISGVARMLNLQTNSVYAKDVGRTIYTMDDLEALHINLGVSYMELLSPVEPKYKRLSRVKLDPEELRRRGKASCRRYYQAHRKEILARAKAYREEKKNEKIGNVPGNSEAL